MPEKKRFTPNTPDPLCASYTRRLMCVAVVTYTSVSLKP